MSTILKLEDISLRLDKLESTSEWLTQMLMESDETLANAAALICSLSDDVRAQVLELATELEKQIELAGNNTLLQ